MIDQSGTPHTFDVRVLRQKGPGQENYWESYHVEYERGMNVISVLQTRRHEIRDGRRSEIDAGGVGLQLLGRSLWCVHDGGQWSRAASMHGVGRCFAEGTTRVYRTAPHVQVSRNPRLVSGSRPHVSGTGKSQSLGVCRRVLRSGSRSSASSRRPRKCVSIESMYELWLLPRGVSAVHQGRNSNRSQGKPTNNSKNASSHPTTKAS